MDKRDSLVLQMELIWWAVTALVVFGVLYPIHKATQVWPFEQWNIIFIVVLITLSRYVFLMPYTFIAKRQVLKIALMLLMFPVTFALVGGLNGFLTFIEENTWESLTGHLPESNRQSVETYIYNEMLFFGAGSVFVAPLFAVRLMRSIWTTRNRGVA